MSDTAPKLTDPVAPPPECESPREAAALVTKYEGIKGRDRVTGEPVQDAAEAPSDASEASG